MECVFDIKRISEEFGANVTAGFDVDADAYFIWAAKDGVHFKQYYSRRQVQQVRDISTIEDSFISSAREA